MRALMLAVLLLAAICAQRDALAAGITQDECDAVVTGMKVISGAEITSAMTGTPNQLDTITFDEGKLTDAIVPLQAMDLLNKEMSVHWAQQHPGMLAYVVGNMLASFAVRCDFISGEVSKNSYTVVLNQANEYGEIQHHELFRFSFTREIWKRINWENFQSKNLEKVSVGFKRSAWFIANVLGD